jgi:hypothetical protein
VAWSASPPASGAAAGAAAADAPCAAALSPVSAPSRGVEQAAVASAAAETSIVDVRIGSSGMVGCEG